MTHKILIADDEPSIVISLEYLMKRGDSMSVARDGPEAIDAVTASVPDLILLDVMMPRKTGFEVCQNACTPDCANMHIVMLTAKGRDTDVAKGMALGATAYMTSLFPHGSWWTRCVAAGSAP